MTAFDGSFAVWISKKPQRAAKKRSKKMTILITGGAGFIGSHTAQKLLENGNDVAVIDNFNNYYDPRLKRYNMSLVQKTASDNRQTAELFEGDIRDAGFIGSVFEKCAPDAVIHLAASAGVRPSIEDPMLYVTTNVVGTANILEAMAKSGVKRLCFASSSSVYGNNKKVPFSESDSVDNPISPYAATKKSGELLCHTYYSLYGIGIACLRFFTVYGPRQRPDLAINKFTRLMLAGKPIPVFGDGTTRRDYTYIDDIVDGIVRALDWTKNDRYDIFNLGENNTVTLSRMIGSIERALGKRAEIIAMDEQPGDVKQTWADVEKSRKVLGYEPRMDFDEGISRFVQWYRENIVLFD